MTHVQELAVRALLEQELPKAAAWHAVESLKRLTDAGLDAVGLVLAPESLFRGDEPCEP